MDSTQVSKTLRLLAGVLLLTGLIGCGSHPGPQPRPSAAASRFTAKDDFGQTLTLSHPPGRIVGLTPNLVEIAYALGLGDRLVGAVEFCDYPPEAAKLPQVGRHDRPNLERIVSLHPDLILMGFGNPRDMTKTFARLGIPVFGANPKTIAGIFSVTERLGTLCGVPDTARQLTEKLTARLEEIKQRLAKKPSARPRVFILIDQDPIWTAGADTLQNEIVRLAGGENIAASRPSYFSFSKEALLAGQPDYILLPAKPQKAAALKRDLLSRKDLAGLSALRQKKILVVDADSFSRPGPRAVEAVAQTFALLFPESARQKEAGDQTKKPEL
jgi:iron complex transport system substrate-binding protein